MTNRVRSRRSILAVSLFAAASSLLVPGTAGALHPDLRQLPPPPPEAQGLERVPNSQVDEFYLRPGASFTAYRRVMIAPVDVSFTRLWERNHREVDAAESLRMRTDLARAARKEFARQLGRKEGYSVAELPGADVLEVRASIVNLDIYAPDVKDAGIRRDYVLKAGEATLVAELRDSQTGALLARAIDRREMREYPEFQLANSVYNSDEARDLVGLWARVLRRYLDAARTDKGS